MVLRARRVALSKFRVIGIVIAVMAFVVQPYVGIMFDETAHAAAVTDHVIINEISPSPTAGVKEWVELYNPTSSAVSDLSGWTLSDAGTHSTALAGSIGVDGFATFDVTGLNNSGDTVYLRNGTTTIDTVTYGKIAPDHTWARTYDASSDFEDRATGSYNATNASVPVVATPVEDTTTGKSYASIQAALSDSATHDNDTITLNADVTTTDYIRITRPITLNGNGHTITASNTVTSSVIDIWSTTGVAISNLTINGNGDYIRGINAYDATVALNDVTVENNGKDGLVVNGSNVTVNNITTSGNGWDGIDVDKTGAVLTVTGTSTHTETGNAIYVDDITTGAKVIDTNNQYFISHPNKENQNPNDRAYNLDRSNLVVDVTSPTDNGIVSTPNHKLVVTGTFSATLNGANYLQTQLVYNGNSKGVVTTYGAVTNGTLAEFDTTGLPEGSGYYIAVVGTDTLGNVSTRKIINFTLDNTKPTIEFVSPSPADGAWVNDDFGVSFHAHDNYKLNYVNVGLRDNTQPVSKQWKAGCSFNNLNEADVVRTCDVKLPADLPDGTYTLQIGGQDAAGLYTVGKTQTIHIDRTAPTGISATYTGGLGDVTIPGSVKGAVLGGNLIFQIAETEVNPSYMYAEINWLNPTTNKWEKHTGWGTAITASSGTLSLPASAPSGVYQIKVSNIKDMAGNVSSTQTFGFTVDNTAPILTIQNPVANSSLKGSMTINGIVTDNLSGLSGQTVTLHLRKVKDNGKLDGFLNTVTAIVQPDGTWSTNLNTADFADGVYGITGFVKDAVGNGQSASGGVSVKPFTIDNTAPVVAITSPSMGELLSYIKNGTIIIKGSVSDINLDHYYYQVYGPGFSHSNTVYTSTSFTDQPLYEDWNLQGLQSGDYVIYVKAADIAGNTKTSTKIHVTVDNTAPTMNINKSNGTTVTGVTDNSTDTVTVDGEAAKVDTTPNTDGAYDWTYTPTTPYGVGTTTVGVISTDTAGNQTKETADVVVAPVEVQKATPETETPSGTATLADATSTPAFQSFAVMPNNDSATIAPTDNTDTAVLGTQTKKDNSSTNPASDEAVLGTNDAKGGTWNIFGLAWYWWLLILAAIAAIIAWIVAAARRAADNSL